VYRSGADPGFQVRGGALKNIAQSRGRRENFWGISCEKSRFYAKKIIFLPILEGACAGCAPPESAPVDMIQNSGYQISYISVRESYFLKSKQLVCAVAININV
jgi:hypothetical protein